MKYLARVLVLFAACLSAAGAMVANADEAQAQRARQLLEKAVAYYKQEGDKSFAAFSRQGEFIDGELYVYVLNNDGVMLASGGPSVMLIGRNILPSLDPTLRDDFQKALKQSESGKIEEADYRWKNWSDGRVERKHTYYQRVDDRIFAVGYYIPRAEPAQAQALLEKTVAEVAKDPQATFKRINDLDKAFIEDDLYAFVIDLNTSKYVAHGFNTRMVGTDFNNVKDPAGKPVGRDMLELAKSKGEGTYDYQWRNPVTEKVESKHTFLRKSGDYLVAVGYYTR
ncbi:cache domain-containing protein [Pseudomonas schmalbachii]|uniref:Cache domain-containing protein n=1 Tax=Pseudomonas schmalbachii TaxID=2816993 RepID=A0ABS3TSK7_9PSED|nr:cache domain-containing protein [Pseudomonas schmalbachii]